MTATVTLTWDEVHTAAVNGLMRYYRARLLGLLPHWRNPQRRQWETDIDGAIAEAAVAKFTGRWWSGMDLQNFGGPDVGSGTQVKCCQRPDGQLIVSRTDKWDRDRGQSFVLTHIVGEVDGGLSIRLVGWLAGTEIEAMPELLRSKEERGAGGGRWPAWFVPQERLRPCAVKR